MNDLSVILRRKWIVGRLRVMVAEERVRRSVRSVRLDMEKIVEIGGFVKLKCFVGD